MEDEMQADLEAPTTDLSNLPPLVEEDEQSTAPPDSTAAPGHGAGGGRTGTAGEGRPPEESSDYDPDEEGEDAHHAQQSLYDPTEVVGVGAEMDERSRSRFLVPGAGAGGDADDDDYYQDDVDEDDDDDEEDDDDDDAQLDEYMDEQEAEEESRARQMLAEGLEGDEFGPDDAQAMLEHLRAVWSRLRASGQDADDDDDEEEEEETETAEEEEEEEADGEDVNYNRTLPATHAYLGEDLDTVAGRTFLSSEQRIVLPIFPLNGIVLLPGETLPLRLFSDSYVGLIRRLLSRGGSADGEVQGTLGVVNIPRQRAPFRQGDDVTRRLARVGTTAEIRSMAKQPSADGAVNALTVGRQRFRILKAWMDTQQYVINAEVVIISDEEPSCPPRGAFASMGGRYCSTPFAPPSRSQRDTATAASASAVSLRGKVMGALPSLPYGRRVFSVGWHPLWVYALYDTRALAQRAKQMFDELILNEKSPQATTSTTSSSSSSSSFSSTADPVSYSFWLAANLPLNDKARQELLEINCAADRLRREMEIMKNYATICCRGCEREIGSSKDVFCMSLETITLRKAKGLALEGSPSTENSWFPGYAWTIAYCARCSAHMGWRFTAVSGDTHPASFYGLSRAAITHASTEAAPPQEE